MAAALVDTTTTPNPALTRAPLPPVTPFTAMLSHPTSRTLIFDPGADESPITVDVVIPVFSEQSALPDSIARLHSYLVERMPFTWRVTIADNASTDGTWAMA